MAYFESVLDTLELLENLLEWARMIQDKIVFLPQTVSLSKISEEMVTFYADHAAEKLIRLGYDVPADLTIQADENIMKNVLRPLKK